jgi:glycosyltransferase involved in cell wall biosynthesis
MSKISVLIPTYNAESTIKETITSAQQQTFADLEIIVIDDGSTDKTVEIVESIRDFRLKLFVYENGGVSVARNRGIEKATGEYIAFLDADDLWTKDKLERQLLALEANSKAKIAYSRTRYIDEEGNCLYECEPVSFEGNVLGDLLLTNFLITGSNPLISYQAIRAVGGFDSSLKASEDWDCYLKLAAHYCFAVVPEYQILYRKCQSPNNLSANVEQMKNSSYIVLERAYKTAPPTLHHLRNQTFSILHLYCADSYLHNSQNNRQDIIKVWQNLWLSIRLQPKSILEKNTQRLLIKYLLRRFFSIGIAHHLLQFFRRNRKAHISIWF